MENDPDYESFFYLSTKKDKTVVSPTRTKNLFFDNCITLKETGIITSKVKGGTEIVNLN